MGKGLSTGPTNSCSCVGVVEPGPTSLMGSSAPTSLLGSSSTSFCGLYSYILIICPMSIIIIICDMRMIIILAMSSIPRCLLTIMIFKWSLTIIINLLLTINNNRNESYKHKLISTIILNQNKHNFIIPALLDDLPVILIIFCQVLCP